MSRPEHLAPPEIYYNENESKKYTTNTRIQEIQAKMSLRAIDLLDLDPNSFILDIGCGSGLSGEILTEEGHVWVGMDISPHMLQVAIEREVDGDLLLSDIGSGVPFRAGTFDSAISISVLQWLLNADTSANNPHTRLMRFFSSLYASLRTGGRACFQFYPESDNSMEMIMSVVKKCGFGGGVVVDEPDSKRQKKCYLLVQAGGTGSLTLKDVQTEPTQVTKRKNVQKKKTDMTTKEYIMHKKDLDRKRGRVVVKHDSKYTGRKRARF